MVGGVGIEGSSVILEFRPRSAAKTAAAPYRAEGQTAANDNSSSEPVKTVTLRKHLEQSGVAVKIKVPVTEYVGVVVSTHITEDGVLSSAIELLHDDPELNYRVFEEVGNSNVVAEWQNWGKLRLPLFIRAGDGSLVPYSQQVDELALGSTVTRHKLAARPVAGRLSSTDASQAKPAPEPKVHSSKGEVRGRPLGRPEFLHRATKSTDAVTRVPAGDDPMRTDRAGPQRGLPPGRAPQSDLQALCARPISPRIGLALFVLAPGAEEILKQHLRLSRADTADHLGAVMAIGAREQTDAVVDGAGLLVLRPVIEAA